MTEDGQAIILGGGRQGVAVLSGTGSRIMSKNVSVISIGGKNNNGQV